MAFPCNFPCNELDDTIDCDADSPSAFNQEMARNHAEILLCVADLGNILFGSGRVGNELSIVDEVTASVSITERSTNASQGSGSGKRQPTILYEELHKEHDGLSPLIANRTRYIE